MLSAIAAACLVTNATANYVGPLTTLRRMDARAAAVALASATALAAPLALTWQQVVAVASWAVGIGSLLVAPVVGVFICDFWVMRGRDIERAALSWAR